MYGYLFLGLALLVLVAGLVARQRIQSARDASGLSDDELRSIEEEGWLQRDEPLDLDEARREEERFLEETWDEPDEPFA